MDEKRRHLQRTEFDMKHASNSKANRISKRPPEAKDGHMKITVCELKNKSVTLDQEWQKLATHVKSESSDLVLLPEMPFYPWIARTNQADDKIWQESVERHERQLSRFEELDADTVIGTRPVNYKGKRLNEGFVWDRTTGYNAVHHK